MVRIYIRHAPPLYDNKNSRDYRFDSGIQESSSKSIRDTARALVAKYGVPSSIVVSPYLRTRQTGGILLDEVLSMGSFIDDEYEEDKIFFENNSEIFSWKRKDRPVITRDIFASSFPGQISADKRSVRFCCDVMLSSFLGFQKNKKPTYKDLRPETSFFEPPLYEHMNVFRNRCRYHFESYLEYDLPDKVVWFVTHSFVMNIVAKTQKVVFQPEPLDCYIIEGDYGERSKVTVLRKGIFTPMKRE